MKKSSILQKLSYKTQITLAILCGLVVGLGVLIVVQLRAHTYLTDDPSACVNCHVMVPYYATWKHSSHGRDATCNDCHVPHENVVKKWAFKGMDGIKHVSAWVFSDNHDVIAASDESAQVIMNNCIRCHEQLTNEFVKDGKMDFMRTKMGEGKACWDCHRDIPHKGLNHQAATQNSEVPYPDAPVPAWVQKLRK